MIKQSVLRERGGSRRKEPLVNMEKTPRYNADQTGLRGEQEDRARRGLKSAARGGIRLGQEQAWRMRTGWQTVSLNLKSYDKSLAFPSDVFHFSLQSRAWG